MKPRSLLAGVTLLAFLTTQGICPAPVFALRPSMEGVQSGLEDRLTSPAAGTEEVIDEPQLEKDNAFGESQRALIRDPYRTDESKWKMTALRKIGPELERYAQEILGDETVRIAIVPLGSTLRGYATEDSDLDYNILILTGEGAPVEVPHSVAAQIARRSAELLEGMGFHPGSVFGGMEVISVLQVIQENPSTRVEVVVANEALAEMFLPVAYGDGEAVRRTRRAVLEFLPGAAGCTWRGVAYHHRRFVSIDPDAVPLKPHLSDWLSEQGIDPESPEAIRAFNKDRGVYLPHYKTMRKIHSAAPTGLERVGDLVRRAEQLLEGSPGQVTAEKAAVLREMIFQAEKIMAERERPDLLRPRVQEIDSGQPFQAGAVVFLPREAADAVFMTDLHGDYVTLERILAQPVVRKQYRIFGGDFVDGGPRSLDVVMKVIAEYLRDPEHTVLMAGNVDRDRLIPDEEGKFRFYRQLEALGQEGLDLHAQFQQFSRRRLGGAVMMGNEIAFVHAGPPSIRNPSCRPEEGLRWLAYDEVARHEMAAASLRRPDDPDQSDGSDGENRAVTERHREHYGASYPPTPFIGRESFDAFQDYTGTKFLLRGHDSGASAGRAAMGGKALTVHGSGKGSAETAYPSVPARYAVVQLDRDYSTVDPSAASPDEQIVRFVWDTTGLEEGIDEPQLEKDNAFGKSLRTLVRGPEVTAESEQRMRALRKIGPELEQYAQEILDDKTVRIAIVPLGSTLRGYATAHSDVDYGILILKTDSRPVRITNAQELNIVKKSERLLLDERSFPEQPEFVNLINISAVLQGDIAFGEEGMMELWFAEVFLPIAYGNAEAIERTRQAVMEFLQGSTLCSWPGVSHHHAVFVDIDPNAVPSRAHLRDWLLNRQVDPGSRDGILDFNKARGSHLPHEGQMLKIYPVSAAEGEEGASQAAGAEEEIDEPQLDGDNAFGKGLRALIRDPYRTDESKRRMAALREIGPELEQYAQDLLGDPNVRIAIVPFGSTLRGYAAAHSDVDYSILILKTDGQPVRITNTQELNIIEMSGKLLLKKGFSPERPEFVNLINVPAVLQGEITSGESKMGEAWFAEVFLPIAYGDAEAIERTRQAVMEFLQGPTLCSWPKVSHHHAVFVDIDPGAVPNKEHLENWLLDQKVDPNSPERISDFNEARGVHLPQEKQMLKIYPVSAAEGEEGASQAAGAEEKIDEPELKMGHPFGQSLRALVDGPNRTDASKRGMEALREVGPSLEKYAREIVGDPTLRLAMVALGGVLKGYAQDPESDLDYFILILKNPNTPAVTEYQKLMITAQCAEWLSNKGFKPEELAETVNIPALLEEEIELWKVEAAELAFATLFLPVVYGEAEAIRETRRAVLEALRLERAPSTWKAIQVRHEQLVDVHPDAEKPHLLQWLSKWAVDWKSEEAIRTFNETRGVHLPAFEEMLSALSLAGAEETDETVFRRMVSHNGTWHMHPAVLFRKRLADFYQRTKGRIRIELENPQTRLAARGPDETQESMLLVGLRNSPNEYSGSRQAMTGITVKVTASGDVPQACLEGAVDFVNSAIWWAMQIDQTLSKKMTGWKGVKDWMAAATAVMAKETEQLLSAVEAALPTAAGAEENFRKSVDGYLHAVERSELSLTEESFERRQAERELFLARLRLYQSAREAGFIKEDQWDWTPVVLDREVSPAARDRERQAFLRIQEVQRTSEINLPRIYEMDDHRLMLEPAIGMKALEQLGPYLKPGTRVLEVGAGDGFLLRVLSGVPPGVEWVETDAYPFLLEIPRVHPPTAQRVLDAVAPPSDDLGTFDLIVCSGFLDVFTREQLRNVFEGFSRRLKPGGRVIHLFGGLPPTPQGEFQRALEQGKLLFYAFERNTNKDWARRGVHMVDRQVFERRLQDLDAATIARDIGFPEEDVEAFLKLMRGYPMQGEAVINAVLAAGDRGFLQMMERVALSLVPEPEYRTTLSLEELMIERIGEATAGTDLTLADSNLTGGSYLYGRPARAQGRVPEQHDLVLSLMGYGFSGKGDEGTKVPPGQVFAVYSDLYFVLHKTAGAEEWKVVTERTVHLYDSAELPEGIVMGVQESLRSALGDRLGETTQIVTIPNDPREATQQMEILVLEHENAVALLDEDRFPKETALRMLPSTPHGPVILISREDARLFSPAVAAAILRLDAEGMFRAGGPFLLKLRQDEIGTHLSIHA